MKPATSSDSASGRSNGGRLVSASAEMKNTTNIGNSGEPMPVEHRVAAGRSVVPMPVLLRVDDVGHVERADAQQHRDDDEADRDLVGHHLRRRPSEPRNAYFELEAQPPMITP